jgi:hypothetical protein
VRGLNFYGDAEIEQMIGLVAEQLDREAEDRDISQIERSLSDIATVVRASLIGLGERPRVARELGIAEAPTPEIVQRARRGLGLETETLAEVTSPRQARLGMP